MHENNIISLNAGKYSADTQATAMPALMFNWLFAVAFAFTTHKKRLDVLGLSFIVENCILPVGITLQVVSCESPWLHDAQVSTRVPQWCNVNPRKNRKNYFLWTNKLV